MLLYRIYLLTYNLKMNECARSWQVYWLEAKILSEYAIENDWCLMGCPVSTPFLLSTLPYEAQDILTQNRFGGPYIVIYDNEGFIELWRNYWKARNSEDWVKLFIE